MRETLFNWLQFDIVGLRCLDLFAGTGALGLEALSRGAGHCTFVELESSVYKQLQSNVEKLRAQDRASIRRQPAAQFLTQSQEKFDLVFVDPPFAENYWEAILQALPEHLNAGARVYLERPIGYSATWPEGWEGQCESRTGDAIGALLHYS